MTETVGRLGTVDLGRCDHLSSLAFKTWVNLGICWHSWGGRPGEHPAAPHVCMSARAVPHQCVCFHGCGDAVADGPAAS